MYMYIVHCQHVINIVHLHMEYVYMYIYIYVFVYNTGVCIYVYVLWNDATSLTTFSFSYQLMIIFIIKCHYTVHVCLPWTTKHVHKCSLERPMIFYLHHFHILSFLCVCQISIYYIIIKLQYKHVLTL